MSLPVVDPPASRTGDASVVGVLLAAGTSSRFGDANKLLEDIDSEAGTASEQSSGRSPRDGEPLVRRSAQTLLDAGLDGVVVVVGHEADRIRDALVDLDVTFVENTEYESGQASSVRAAVRALRDASGPGAADPLDAAVFALGDMPYVEAASVRALVAAYERATWTALAAGFEGERGNPVLFDVEHFPDLAASEDDTGGKQVLLDADGAAIVETGDPGVRWDVDEPGDLE